MGQVAIDMDQDDLKIPYNVRRLILMALICDVLDIKKLTLFVYHAALWCFHTLALTEVKMS